MPNRFEIVLVRHGKSALPFRNRLTIAEFRDWIAEYNRTGIAADSHPESALIELATTATHIVCSDYPRALESAGRIAPTVIPQITPILREAGRPVLWNLPVRLPLDVWDNICGLLWRLGLSRTDESYQEAKDRAAEAAEMLIELAETHQRVLVVGHGIFSRMVSEALLREGWRGPKPPELQHWGFAIYQDVG